VSIATHIITSTLSAETLTIHYTSPVPKYASACSGTSRYASACECAGITASSTRNTVTVTSVLTVYTVPLITITKSWSSSNSHSIDTSSNHTPPPSSIRTPTTYKSQGSSHSTMLSSWSVPTPSPSSSHASSSSHAPSSSHSPLPSPSPSLSPSPLSSPSPSPSCSTYLLQARYGINAGGNHLHVSPSAIEDVYELVFDPLPFGDRSKRTAYRFTLDTVGRLGSNINGSPFHFEARTPTSTPNAVIDVADSFGASQNYPLNCSIDAGSSELSCSVDNDSEGHDTTNLLDCTYDTRLWQGTDTSAPQCIAAQIVAIPDC
jgi:hypothetical protein